MTTATPDPWDDHCDATVFDVLARNADHPSAFLAMNDATQHFHIDRVDGLIAYQLAGRKHAVMLCGPFTRPADRPLLLSAFCDWAAEQKRRVAAVQLLAPDARLFAERGFTVNQIGTSHSIHLPGYNLDGRDFTTIRRNIRKARREGVVVAEMGYDSRDESLAEDLDRVDRAWQHAKGHQAMEMDFMNGQRDGRGSAHRRLFVASAGGKAVAYITYAPAFGSQPGWLYDLSHRLPDAPRGAVEAVFSTSVEAFQADGAEWLHFGLTPFAGLNPDHAIADAQNRHLSRLLQVLAENKRLVYPTASQAAFKLKWRPHVVRPEYVAFDQSSTPGVLWSVVRLASTAWTSARQNTRSRTPSRESTHGPL